RRRVSSVAYSRSGRADTPSIGQRATGVELALARNGCATRGQQMSGARGLIGPVHFDGYDAEQRRAQLRHVEAGRRDGSRGVRAGARVHEEKIATTRDLSSDTQGARGGAVDVGRGDRIDANVVRLGSQ